MDYNKAKKYLEVTLEIDLSIGKKGEKNRMTPMLWGGAGVGKSSLVKQVGAEIGYEVREIRLSTLSPVDVRGVPYVSNDNAEHFRFVPPSFMPTGKEEKPVLLFFDEINTAPPLNQVVAYEISLDRRMGGHPLPENTLVVMAGNRVQDRGATFEMSLPLANRLVHIDLEASEDVFIEYGLKKGFSEGILAFIKWKPSLLTAKPDGNKYAFPSPRSWENAARFVEKGFGRQEVSGVIGDAASVELFEFLKLRDVLPDLDETLKKGTPFKHAEDSVMYFYAVALSARLLKIFETVKKDEEAMSIISNFVKALDNTGQEMQALAITCVQQNSKIVMCLAKDRKLFTQIRSILK